MLQRIGLGRISLVLTSFFGVLVLAVLATGLFAIIAINAMVDALGELQDDRLPALEIATQLQRDAESLVSLAPRLAGSPSQAIRTSQYERITDRLAGMGDLCERLPESIVEDGLRSSIASLQKDIADTLAAINERTRLMIDAASRADDWFAHLRSEAKRLQAIEPDVAVPGSGANAQGPGAGREALSAAITTGLAMATISHHRTLLPMVARFEDRVAAATRELALQPESSSRDSLVAMSERLVARSAAGIEAWIEALRLRQENRSLMYRSDHLSTQAIALTTALFDRISKAVTDDGRALTAKLQAFMIAGCVVLLLAIGIALAGHLFVRRRFVARLLALQTAMDDWRVSRRPIPESPGADELAQIGQHLAALTGAVESREAELRQNQELLERLNRQKDRFFSILAHDLRGSFSGMSGYLELLTLELASLPNSYAADYLTRLTGSVEAASALIESLLQWGRLQMERADLAIEPVDIGSVTKAACMAYGSMAESKRIEIRTDAPSNLAIDADEGLVRTLLRNLVGNAIKFTPAGGTISATAWRDGDTVCVRVADTGRGIPPDRLDRLFDLGSRTSTPGTAGERGSGLGLPLCKEIVDRHGGTLSADSTIDVGTAMTVTLPIRQPNVAGRETDASSTAG